MINVGLHLYTVRNEAEKDFIGTLEKVAAIGYKGLEFGGYYGLNAKVLRKVLDGLNVQAMSSHIPIMNMVKNFNSEIEFVKVLGIDTIVISWLPDEFRKDKNSLLKTSELLNELAEKCLTEGIQLCFHNHDFDFKKIDEEYILDLFLRKAINLKLEFDTFWSAYAGINSVEYMKKCSKRIKFLHLKDMIKDSKPVYAEIGEGCLDNMSFIKTVESFGVEWLFVEQDECKRSCLESAKISFDNLLKMGVVK